MFDLTKAEDLNKGGRSIGNFFAKQVAELEKNFAHHQALAAHHNAMASEHTSHAAAHKAHHDGLPNEDVHKAMFSKNATHHVAMAAHHDAVAKAYAAHADTMKTEITAMKAMAADWGGAAGSGAASSLFARSAAANGGSAPLSTPSGNPFEDMVKETTAQLAKKTLETFDNDEEVKQFMRETIMKMVGDAIGNSLVPTGVSVVAPPKPGTLTPRPGAPAAPVKPAVDSQFSKLVAVEEEETSRPVM